MPPARDLAVNQKQAAGAAAHAQEPLPPEAGTHQIVVGDILRQPPGFQPLPHLMGQLDQPGPAVSVLTGAQGVGKSQLAAAYARAKLAAGWRLVAWVNGADTGSLLAGLAAVADAIGVANDGSGQDIAVATVAVRHWLETDGDRCLLVFDDVSDPEALQPFIPTHGAARVLITSTWQSAANLGSGVPVDLFNAEEASAFLDARTGLDDEAGAAAVAAALGHLPLALALAAPVIAGGHLGYGWYLDRLQAMSADMSLTGKNGQPYPPGLAPVLLSLQAVRAADQTGVCTRVVEIMAVLSAAGVRRELLHVAGQAGVLAGGRRVTAALVDQVLEWLGDLSLLTFSLDGQIVILHRLVAQVIRDGLAHRQRLAAVCRVVATVLEAYAVTLAGSQDRAAIRGIPQHVTALLDHAAALAGEADEELAGILLRLRFVALYHLIELGDSASQAIAVGESLTADLERLLGPDHPDTLNSRNSLASAYLAVGRAAEAIPQFEQTLAVRKRLLGSDHPDTLTSQNNLAVAYQDDGQAAEAIRLYEHTLALRERLLGVGHPSTLTSRGNLAAAYQDAGRVSEAIPLFEQALAGRERVLGPGHPDTQTSRMNLAHAYQDAGRVSEAIPLFQQALADRKRVLGPAHPHTEPSRGNAPTTYWDGGWAAKTILPVERIMVSRQSQPPDDAAGRALPASLRQPPDDAAGRALPASLRRPPADPVRRMLPTDFRRPPADPARRLPPDHDVRPSAKLTGNSSPGLPQHSPAVDLPYNREVVAAVTAGDPAGIAMAYDSYAAALYGYCHWMLRDSAEAAETLQDTFVIAAATLSDLVRALRTASVAVRAGPKRMPTPHAHDVSDPRRGVQCGEPAGECGQAGRYAGPAGQRDPPADRCDHDIPGGQPAGRPEPRADRCDHDIPGGQPAGRPEPRADRCDHDIPGGQPAGRPEPRADRYDHDIPGGQPADRRGRPGDRCDHAIADGQPVGRADGRPEPCQRRLRASRTPDADPFHSGRPEAS